MAKSITFNVKREIPDLCYYFCNQMYPVILLTETKTIFNQLLKCVQKKRNKY